MQEPPCRQAQVFIRLHEEGDKIIAIRLHSSVCALLLPVPGRRRYSGCSRRLRKGVDGKVVHHGDVCDGYALGEDPENVPACLSTGCRAVRSGARAGGETREAAEGWLEGRGNARPVHGMAQNLFQDVVAQRDLCSQGGAAHAVAGV
jgi:hypothetical protein